MMSPEEMDAFAKIVMPQMIYCVQELGDGLTHQFIVDAHLYAHDKVGLKKLNVFVVNDIPLREKIEAILAEHYGE